MSKARAVFRAGALLLSLFLLSTCSLFDKAAGWVDTVSGLVAHYPFNGNAEDATHHGNDGTELGATLVEDRHGNPDGAYSFDGIDDYIDVGGAASLNPPYAMTITAWVYVRSFSTTWPPIVKKNGSGGDEYTGYSLECNTIGPHFVFSICQKGPELFGQSGGAVYEPGRWYFVAAVWDGTTCSMYLDGSLVISGPCEGQLEAATNHLYIGHDPYHTDRYFDGVIDDIYIFDRALVDFEIQSLYRR